MRVNLTLTAFLFAAQMSFAQYDAQTRKCPMNPFPMQYTVKQFLLYHNVKKVDYKSGYNEFVFHFNPDGTLAVWDTGIGKTKYSYDKNGHLSSKNDGYVSSRIKTNDKGFILEEAFKDGSGSIYVYNDEGRYSERRNLQTKAVEESYLYNGEGRLIKTTFYDAKQAPSESITYGYEDLITHLKVITTTKMEGNALPTKATYYFTKRGERSSDDYKNDRFEKDRKSNVISHYDSANNATTTFDITYY